MIAGASDQRAAALQQQSACQLTSLTREVEELKRQAGKRKRDDGSADAGAAGASGTAPDAIFGWLRGSMLFNEASPILNVFNSK
jgi:hypothetical protein